MGFSVSTLHTEFPIGYVFSWAPVEGQSIDLSTAEKVSSYFGYGTWKEIQGYFLFGRDDSHEVNSVGGEETHTLTTSEIPSHSHSLGGDLMIRHSNSLLGSGQQASLYALNTKSATSNAGGGQSHNNMPPYFTVYMWQRIK